MFAIAGIGIRGSCVSCAVSTTKFLTTWTCILFSTTMLRISRPPFSDSSYGIHVLQCILRQRVPVGLVRSNGFFAEITRRRMRRGTFTSVPNLEQEIRAYFDDQNANAKPFIWTATADTIFAKLSKHNRANL